MNFNKLIQDKPKFKTTLWLIKVADCQLLEQKQEIRGDYLTTQYIVQV